MGRGLSDLQRAILERLHEVGAPEGDGPAGPMRQAWYGTDFGADASARAVVSRALARLEARGLVTRLRRTGMDGRRFTINVRLTEAGRQLRTEGRPAPHTQPPPVPPPARQS